MALLLPGLSKARNAAVDINCAYNLHQIGIAFYTLATDNSAQYPEGVTPQ